MRILWSANVPWLPAHGGGNKVNRVHVEGLAALGHEVRAVLPMAGQGTGLDRATLRAELRARGATLEARDWLEVARLDGYELHLVEDPARLRSHLVEQLRAFRPDRVVVTSDDVSQRLLSAAVQEAADRVVYYVLTTSFLPFGPQAFFPGEERAGLVKQVRAIVAISDFLAGYLRAHAGLASTVLRVPIYGGPPYPNLACFDAGALLMINPCALKGLPIFLALARHFPSLPFAAVPTWGTSEADRAALSALPNVTLLAPDEDIDRVLEAARLVVMPSLWAETFGLTCVEAMLRGLPVLASAVGGLVEAKLGTDYLLPVAPVEQFDDPVDARMLGEPIVPPQDLAPWIAAVERLTTDRAEYERQSALARAAAHRYLETATVERFADFLAHC